MDSRSIDVSIVMPVLNEEKTLQPCIDIANQTLDEIKKTGMTGEIVISDNGSCDSSIEIARKNGVFLTHAKKKGYGNALQNGIHQANGQYIVMGDADCSYDFRESVKMIDLLQQGYDLVMGNRFAGEILPGAMPWKNRYIGNPGLTWLLNILYGLKFGDAHCGLRAFTKEAFLKMDCNSPGMEFASEIVVKAGKLKMKTAEVPITLHPDERGGKPHLRPWRDGMRHVIFLLRNLAS